MSGKLTKAQQHALEILDSWRAGFEVPLSRLKFDGVSLSTLRTLENIDLVSSARYSNGIFWKITALGRTAIKQGAGE